MWPFHKHFWVEISKKRALRREYFVFSEGRPEEVTIVISKCSKPGCTQYRQQILNGWPVEDDE